MTVWSSLLGCIAVLFGETQAFGRNITDPISNGNTWGYDPENGTPQVFMLRVSVLEVTKMTNVNINIQQYRSVTVNRTL
jgi:hypothetical protein